ncbi:restriction endonuclease subunit S [Vagococcus jeotgali]|uniref:restriction endonuclease subunit S n=1 Tax=Vagococcus jeotgali TaxID=3109030 RepID=UPI002DDC5302|nr:restriction endonuclease subunit S [Vagococcus sp. B2T-5]
MRYSPLINKNTPNSWKNRDLNELTTYISRGKQPKYVEKSDILVLNQKSVRWNYLERKYLKYHNPEIAVPERHYIKKQDVVINSTGVGTVGRAYYFKNVEQRMFADSHVTIVRTDDSKLISEYLYYQISDKRFQNYINNSLLAGSTGQVELNKSKVEKMAMLVPDLLYQKNVVTILSSLDSKIELNNQMIDTLEEMASALFKRWFVDFEFPDENGNPYKSSGGKMVDSELGEIPEGWEIKRIKSIVTITRGASPRPIKDFIHNEGRPWIKISDANATFSPYIYGTKEFIKEEGVSKSRTVESDTLILSNSATPGIPKIVKMLSSVHDGWLIFDSFNELSKEFLYLFLIEYKKDILSLSNGSVFRNLKTDILKEFPIILPQKEEFEKFQLIVVDLFSNINTLALEVLALESLRDALIPKLLSGELEV